MNEFPESCTDQFEECRILTYVVTNDNLSQMATAEIIGLKPYTNYVVCVKAQNVYGSVQVLFKLMYLFCTLKLISNQKIFDIAMLFYLFYFQNSFDSGIFSTEEGPPGVPSDVTARPLSPESLEVSWQGPSEDADGPHVSYEVHYSLNGYVLQVHDEERKR